MSARSVSDCIRDGCKHAQTLTNIGQTLISLIECLLERAHTRLCVYICHRTTGQTCARCYLTLRAKRDRERERKGSNKNPLRAFTNREPKSKRKKSRRYSLCLFVRNNSFACITMCAPLALHHYSRSESFEMGDEWLDRERVDVVLVTALANHTAARGTRCARTNDVMYSPIHDSYVQPQ